ncbi:MAG TPA: DUF11 domain-containing protein [Chloroflexia bacterium]|nr:DUF11 domain-containing protein [Chloroflexia bacterium]
MMNRVMSRTTGTGLRLTGFVSLCMLALLALAAIGGMAPASTYAQTAGPTPTAIPPTPGPVGRPNVTIHKSSTPYTVPVGAQLTYTILVANDGTADAHDVVMTDNVPGQLQIISVTTTKGDVQINGQRVVVSIGTLAPGESVTITIVAFVRGGNDGDTIHNVSNVRTAEGDDRDSAVDNLVAKPILPRSGTAGDFSWALMLAVLAAAGLGAGLVLRRRMPAR